MAPSEFVQTTLNYLALQEKLSVFEPAVGPQATIPGFDPSHRSFTDEGMSIEFNVDIPARDGVLLRGDVYLPEGWEATFSPKLPVVLVVTPFGKQPPLNLTQIPPSRDFDPGMFGLPCSKYAPFEGSDPRFWTQRGFAYVAVDSRGSYASEGKFSDALSKLDGLDAYDIIEHVAVQPYSNGRVGMIGASGLGYIQWAAASLQPPHLAAILVQDSLTDMYRDVACKGGVPHSNFLHGLDKIYRPHGNKTGCPNLSFEKSVARHPFYDDFWALHSTDTSTIKCAMYIVCSLADNGVHTQGTLRGYLAARAATKETASASQHYLELHPYKKWYYQLCDESFERQAAFFHKVLDGTDRHAAGSVDYWPSVRLFVSEKYCQGFWRSESAWPLPNAVRTKLYLGVDGTMVADKPDPATAAGATAQYDAATGGLVWSITFTEQTEITGSARLHLRFSVGDNADDADLFVTLQKKDYNGRLVHFPYHTFINEGHVAWGWLRASMRAEAPPGTALGDEVLYTYLEKDVQHLHPHEPVDLNINIQPSSTVFRKGETLLVALQGRDFGEFSADAQLPRAGTGLNKEGVVNTISLSESYLEVPFIPSRK